MGLASTPNHLRLLNEEVADAIQLNRVRPIRLVVIVPALNEEKTIDNVVRRIPRLIEGVDEVEVLVVDDGSTDATPRLARLAGAHVVSHPKPCGVGSAFQTGLRRAFELGAEYIVNIDGDGQFKPEDIPKLLAPIMNGESDFVTASRFKDPALIPKMTWIKKWGNRQVARLISHLTGTHYHDVSCGMRAYGREAALSLSLLEKFSYTHEVFLHLTAKRMRLTEMPIEVRGIREFGKSRVASNLFKYAHNTLRIVFRAYRDYYPLRFFSILGTACLAVGLPLLAFLSWHYAQTSTLSPHKWAGFVGGAFCLASVISFCLGVLGDMLNRQRLYLEEIQYHVRLMVMLQSRQRQVSTPPKQAITATRRSA